MDVAGSDLFCDTDLKCLIHFELYLAEYCVESLREITLCGIQPNRTAAFEITKIQFPNVGKVHTVNCYFGDNFSFETNFPNVQSLRQKSVSCTFNAKYWHFPTVKNLYFNCCKCESGKAIVFTGNDLIEMFQRQPQLEKLKLLIFNHQFTPDLGKCFNDFLPNLQSLVLHFIDFIPLEAVHLEHITNFSLILRYLAPHKSIPFTFNRLEHFKIDLRDSIRTDPESVLISEFISKNKHLKTIGLKGIQGDIQHLFESEHVLLNVKELSICGFQNISSDCIKCFLTQSQSLKLLRICGIDGNTDAIELKISERIPHVRWDGHPSLEKVLEFVFRL